MKEDNLITIILVLGYLVLWWYFTAIIIIISFFSLDDEEMLKSRGHLLLIALGVIKLIFI